MTSPDNYTVGDIVTRLEFSLSSDALDFQRTGKGVLVVDDNQASLPLPAGPRGPVGPVGHLTKDDKAFLDDRSDAAASSAAAAKTSETNAKSSETKAKTSETNAKTSETKAKASEEASASSATASAESASAADLAKSGAEGAAARAETAEAGAVTARTGSEAGQELSEDASAVAVAAAIGAAEASSDIRQRVSAIEPKTAGDAGDTAFAHVTEQGHRLPLGYDAEGRLDQTARRVWREDVVSLYSMPGSGFERALVTEGGHLLLGITADGGVEIPGLKATGEDSPTRELWMSRDGTIQPAAADMANLVVWGSSTPNLLVPHLRTAVSDLPVTVIDQAHGGEKVEHAAGRMGVIPALVDEVTIPASGPVAITAPNIPYQNILWFDGTLGGIHGRVLIDSANSTFTFTRFQAGDPVTIPTGTPLIPDDGPNQRAMVTLIGAGKNNIYDPPELVIDYNDRMFNYLTPRNPRVLFLGMHSNTTHGDTSIAWVDEINNYQRTKYGPLFVDIKAWMISEQAWADTGITPTSEDLAHQAAGRLPPSLAMDGAHMNDAAHAVVAGLIRDRMISLGWY